MQNINTNPYLCPRQTKEGEDLSGSKQLKKIIMKKWICKECGYTHEGDEAPERCPKCGANKSQFYQEGKNKGCCNSLLALMAMLTAPIAALLG